MAIQGIAIQVAAQAEYDGDQKRTEESKWSDGKWSEIMESYLKSSQPLIDAVPQVKEIYEDWKNKGDGERDVEELWKQLEDLSGRKGRKFPRSFSIQGEGWKAKGEWIGYSTSLKLFAKVLKEHGPVSFKRRDRNGTRSDKDSKPRKCGEELWSLSSILESLLLLCCKVDG